MGVRKEGAGFAHAFTIATFTSCCLIPGQFGTFGNHEHEFPEACPIWACGFSHSYICG
jgi:hypothetical protein